MKEVKIYPKTELNCLIKIIVDAYHQGKSWVASAFFKVIEENRVSSTVENGNQS